MIKVMEFRHIQDLNDYLGQVHNYSQEKLTIIPVPRLFQNPSNNLFTNTITYVVIEED